MTTKQYNSAKNSRIIAIIATAAGLIFSAAGLFTDPTPTLANYLLIFLFAFNLVNAIIHKPIPPQDTQN